MPFFTLYDHPQLPLVTARVSRSAKPFDKDGFRLRYQARISDSAQDGAELVIEMLDDAMGKRTKAPGVYNAKYDEVRAAYAEVMAASKTPRGSPWLRWGAFVLAMLIILAMVVCFTILVPSLLFFGAIKRQSGFAFMAEVAIITDLFDWRPTIAKLARYFNEA